MVFVRARDLSLGAALRGAASLLLLGGTLAACAPAHRAKRDPEPPPEVEPARPTPQVVLLPQTATTTVAAEPQPPPWAPTRVDVAVLRAARVQSGIARVSMELARQYGATRRTVSIDVCVGLDGGVDPLHTKQVDGPFDVGELVRTTVLQWRFQPRKTPTCAVFNFLLHRDGYCREEG